jgi:6-phosphogluconolactonase
MKSKKVGLVTLGALAVLSLCVAAVRVSAATVVGNDDQAGASVSATAIVGNSDKSGAVYVSTNETTGNAVLVFNRSVDGTLTPGGRFSTGGLGTGGREPDFGLGNAGALALSQNNRFLFAVNPRSDDISVFAVEPDRIELIDRISSGGQQPISVTVNRNLLYVLNAGGNVGGSDNIAGFVVDGRGKLSPLSGSIRPLSAAATAPAEVRFRPDGKVLVVTEKTTNMIDTYTVGYDGRATGPTVTPSGVQTPFGFDLKKNQLFVTDDFNDAKGEGALSSWLVKNDGNLQLVSSVVPANETGACWVKVSQDDRFAYVSDTVSSTEAVYTIDSETGSVTLDDAFPSLVGPTELDFSSDGRFLYVLNPNEFNQTIPPGVNSYRVNQQDGSLTPLPGVSGLPASVDGLVAR